ncbi:MAG: GntR family transcriptional regulator [Bacilli bacterium]|nr:GntR family transcriptional regulator [Bacilli bacterium]
MAKYKDIANDIRSKITDGEYTYGQKLPYEYVLCMRYNCNKETMKKALDILVKEGLIIRRRGAGTFVKDYDPSDLKVTKFTKGLTAQYKGVKKVTSQILEFEVIPADDILAKKLQIDEGDFVYHIIRLRFLDNNPHLIDISYFPLSIIPNLKLENLKGSIYEYIEKNLKLHIQSTHISITSLLSTPLEQEFLGLKENEPFIQEEQTSYLSNGQIFEYTFSRHHYAKYEFQTIIIQQ